MIDGSHLKWDVFDFGTAVRLSNNVDDENELCEKSLNVETPESIESILIVDIVSNGRLIVVSSWLSSSKLSGVEYVGCVVLERKLFI